MHLFNFSPQSVPLRHSPFLFCQIGLCPNTTRVILATDNCAANTALIFIIQIFLCAVIWLLSTPALTLLHLFLPSCLSHPSFNPTSTHSKEEGRRQSVVVINKSESTHLFLSSCLVDILLSTYITSHSHVIQERFNKRATGSGILWIWGAAFNHTDVKEIIYRKRCLSISMLSNTSPLSMQIPCKRIWLIWELTSTHYETWCWNKQRVFAYIPWVILQNGGRGRRENRRSEKDRMRVGSCDWLEKETFCFVLWEFKLCSSIFFVLWRYLQSYIRGT